MRRSETLTAITIALVYFLVAETWDILSDIFFTGLDVPLSVISQSIILKDLVFSLVTALLLFATLRYEFNLHKKTGLALRESEERYQSIFENSLDGILLTAPDGQILAANPAACRIFGMTETEIRAAGRAGLVDLSDPRVEIALQERARSGFFQTELFQIRKDGSRFPTEVTSSVFRDKEGHPRTSMIIRDITRRKQEEAAQRENEARMRLVVEKMPAVLWATDRELRYTYSIGAAMAHFGLKPNQLVGMQVGSTAIENDQGADYTRAQHQRVLREGVAVSYDVQWGERYFHIELEPLRDEQGLISGTIGAALDITERVRAYQLLEKRVEERTFEIERRRLVAEGLREIVTILNSNRPLEEILQTIVAQTHHILLADSAALYLPLAENGLLAVQAAAGWDAECQKDFRFAAGEGPVGQAVQRREPVILRDVVREMAQTEGILASDRLQDCWQQAGAGSHGLVVVPLIVKGEPYGAIRLTYLNSSHLTPEEVGLAVALADQAAMAIENTRLSSQAGQLAVMNERNRLARELHDSVTQSIYSLTLMAEADRRRLEAGEYQQVKQSLVRLGQTAQQALKEIRLLVYELRPQILERKGLVGAIQQRLDAVEGRAGVETQLLVNQPVELPFQMAEALYRITQEALNNALKHARASRVIVKIHSDEDTIGLEIADNGQGFDLAALPDSGGMGLVNMRERVDWLGGTLEILSKPGHGTTIKVTACRI